MENFPIVLALARIAHTQSVSASSRQLKRLLEALENSGDTEQANAIARLLESEDDSALRPTRVVMASAELLERMTKSVRVPSDKETGAPLASIHFPGEVGVWEEPILNGVLQGAIDSLIDEWTNWRALADAGVRPPLNLLLYGVPGTGKTRLAHLIAQRMGLPLVVARLDGLISSFLGTTARNIAMLFEFASRYNCILLLDEFDALAKVRDDPHEIGEIKRVVNTLLQCLDGRRDTGFTIAVTNHEHLLDAAIWRRFDARVHVPLPDAPARRSIAQRYLTGIDFDPVDVDLIAWLTEGRSGAEIESLCSALKRHAVISGSGRTEILAGLRTHALLSADLNDSARTRLFFAEDDDLARALAADTDFKFTQEALAGLFNAHQSTISRWIRR